MAVGDADEPKQNVGLEKAPPLPQRSRLRGMRLPISKFRYPPTLVLLLAREGGV